MKLFIYLLLFLSFFNTACAKTHKIASIPEASGICYASSSDTLFVVHDEGKVYEISKSGDILRHKFVGKYDFEGVACDSKKGLLYVAVEKDDSIFTLSMKSLEVLQKSAIRRTYNGKLLLKKDKKRGLEGISFDEDYFYVANQSKKAYPKKDSSVIVKVKRKLKKNMKIVGIIDPKHPDISGLFVKGDILYMLSDTKNKLYAYSLKKKKIIKKYKLPKFAQEGVTFDNSGNIYLADDNGAVFKYKSKKLLK